MNTNENINAFKKRAHKLAREYGLPYRQVLDERAQLKGFRDYNHMHETYKAAGLVAQKTRTAHVICCNDSVEHVVLDDEEVAKEKLEELAKAYYDKHQLRFEFPDYAQYRERVYWHIHSTPAS